MATQDIELMAHLIRRAGFGATRDELEHYVEKGYDETVEELLNPSDPNPMPDDLIRRYHVDLHEGRQLDGSGAYWLYRMITTKCPLEEKLALFYHSLLATGYSKLNQAPSQLNQIDMFRRYGFGDFRDLLIELSRDPAMIIWLDNNENHVGAINENYGRELLELFSMGIGNYSEDDVKEAARAFTGWTLGNAEYMATRAMKDSIWPYGRIAWHFEYRPDDHDDGEKTFLGETGNFTGEDIVDIIVKQDATARFICTRLYQYFAADVVTETSEPTIKAMIDSYFESGHEIRSVLRTLFNSDHFKSDETRFARIKSPVELIVGAIRMSGSYQTPTLGANSLWAQTLFMGQGLLLPPSVEGWHEGVEWIDSGSLVERINFAATELSDVSKPGVKSIIERIANTNGGIMSPSEVVDACLDQLGPLHVSGETRTALTEFAEQYGDFNLGDREPGDDTEQQIGNLIRLVASSREYQLA